MIARQTNGGSIDAMASEAGSDKRVLIIGGPTENLPQYLDVTIVRVKYDLSSILSATRLHDFHHIILWPTEDVPDIGTEADWANTPLRCRPPKSFWTLIQDTSDPDVDLTRYSPGNFRQREGQLLENLSDQSEARELAAMLRMRGIERLHEIIEATVGGANTILVGSAECPGSFMWISPIFRVKSGSDRIVERNSDHEDAPWMKLLARIANDSITDWSVTFLLSSEHEDFGHRTLLQSEVLHTEVGRESAAPEQTSVDRDEWHTILHEVEGSIDGEWSMYDDNEDRLFNGCYFGLHPNLQKSLQVFIGHTNGAGQAKSVAIQSGEGCMLAIPQPNSLSALVESLVRSSARDIIRYLELSDGGEAGEESAILAAKSVQENLVSAYAPVIPIGEIKKAERGPDDLKLSTVSPEILALRRKLEGCLPRELETKSGRGNHLKFKTVEEHFALLCGVTTRNELYRALAEQQKASDITNARVDYLKRKLGHWKARHERLKEFADTAIALINQLPIISS